MNKGKGGNKGQISVKQAEGGKKKGEKYTGVIGRLECVWTQGQSRTTQKEGNNNCSPHNAVSEKQARTVQSSNPSK